MVYWLVFILIFLLVTSSIVKSSFFFTMLRLSYVNALVSLAIFPSLFLRTSGSCVMSTIPSVSSRVITSFSSISMS